jgi:hypothetical protein
MPVAFAVVASKIVVPEILVPLMGLTTVAEGAGGEGGPVVQEAAATPPRANNPTPIPGRKMRPRRRSNR